MDINQRDMLVGQIRSGYIYLSRNIKLKPMSIDLFNESMFVYQDAYAEAVSQELMSLEDSFLFLETNEVFTKRDQLDLDNFQTSLEDRQEELYQQKSNKRERKNLRRQIKDIKTSISIRLNKKNSLYEHTCEYYADTKKNFWLLPKLAMCKKKNINPSPRYLSSLYSQSIIQEEKIRDLALQDPWRSLWVMKDVNNLFYNKEYNFNQKNIILWSITYDNVRQSMDAPDEQWYKEHDIIDAWFVWSSRKSKKEKAANELEKTGKGVADHKHHFTMLDPDNDITAKDVYARNSAQSKEFISNIQKHKGGKFIDTLNMHEDRQK